MRESKAIIEGMKHGISQEILSILTFKYDYELVKMAKEADLIKEETYEELINLGDKIIAEKDNSELKLLLYEKYFIALTFK